MTVVMILLAAVLSLVLMAIALLHAYWGLGGIWPEKTASDLAHAMVGDGRTRMPGPFACFLVALILAVIAAWPWLILTLPKDRFVFGGGLAITGVFIARGLAGYSLHWRVRHGVEPFATRDKLLYSPLCLALGAAFAVLIWVLIVKRM